MNEEASTNNPKANESPTDPNWERETINRLLFTAFDEQRRARRWNVFFKLIFILYLLILPGLYLWEEFASFWDDDKSERHTALVEIDGVISDSTDANADKIIGGLRAAFADSNTAGVVIRINSPGGSPVQAGYINDEIWRLRKKYSHIPIYAVIRDICASGGYYIAVAAQKIYADKSSLIGSIGVRMDSFGFVAALEKLGIERRLLTAGEHKGFLDPFLPKRPEEVAHIQSVLADIHRNFIEVVKRGRGKRIKDDDSKLFNGLVWTGVQAQTLGLIDALGSTSFVAREVFKAEKIRDYTQRPDYWEDALKYFETKLVGVLPRILHDLTAPKMQ